MKPSGKGKFEDSLARLSPQFDRQFREVPLLHHFHSQHQGHDLPTESAAKWLFELVNSDTSSSATSLYDVVPFR